MASEWEQKLKQEDTYEQLTKTCEAYDTQVKELRGKNIKADFARRIAAHVNIVEIEPTEPPEPEDQSRYGEELRRELEHSYDRLNVPESKREDRGDEL